MAIKRSIEVTPNVEAHLMLTEQTNLKGIDGVVDRQNILFDTAYAMNADYLWIVQADVEVPKNALKHLLSLDVDVAYGVVEYHGRRSDFIAGLVYEDCRVNYLPRSKVENHVILNDRAMGGCSCVLIKRAVIAKVQFHNTHVGEDILFASDVFEAGFNSAIDGCVICGHLPDKPLSERSRWGQHG